LGISLWIFKVIRDEELSRAGGPLIKKLHRLSTKERDEELSQSVMNNSQKCDEQLSQFCDQILLKPCLHGLLQP